MDSTKDDSFRNQNTMKDNKKKHRPEGSLPPINNIEITKNQINFPLSTRQQQSKSHLPKVKNIFQALKD